MLRTVLAGAIAVAVSAKPFAAKVHVVNMQNESTFFQGCVSDVDGIIQVMTTG